MMLVALGGIVLNGRYDVGGTVRLLHWFVGMLGLCLGREWTLGEGWPLGGH